ncbi:toxic anion resistance protein [Parachitinimonas caeni]|uniref:toxic anion resistance protein n=1 Tax=Parachitinimonas caeni TaxID=3031301 RepID=UPI0024DE56A8|nr:toxic anion resistance protein [Parachitinimonas caeni]
MHAALTLTPPEPIRAIEICDVAKWHALPAASQQQIDDELAVILDGLLRQDLQAPAFASAVDQVFLLGREEMRQSAQLISLKLLPRNQRGVSDGQAMLAMTEMRRLLEALNPARAGDLSPARKLFGLIPRSGGLSAYFKRFQQSGAALQAAMNQLYVARDDLARDDIELAVLATKLQTEAQRLAEAAQKLQQLDEQLAAAQAMMSQTDPERSRRLRQDVSYFVRQNLQDLQTQQAVCLNGYASILVLQKAGRELSQGCERLAVIGISALAVAQMVARQAGEQLKVTQLLQGINQSIEQYASDSGPLLGLIQGPAAALPTDTATGVERLKAMFDLSLRALDAIETFRQQTAQTAGDNEAILRSQLQQVRQAIDKPASMPITSGQVSGPVVR